VFADDWAIASLNGQDFLVSGLELPNFVQELEVKLVISSFSGSIRELLFWTIRLDKPDIKYLEIQGPEFVIHDFISDLIFSRSFCDLDLVESNVVDGFSECRVDFGSSACLKQYCVIFDALVSSKFAEEPVDIFKTSGLTVTVFPGGEISTHFQRTCIETSFRYDVINRIVVLVDLLEKYMRIYVEGSLVFVDELIVNDVTLDDSSGIDEIWRSDGPLSIGTFVCFKNNPDRLQCVSYAQVRTGTFSHQEISAIKSGVDSGPFRSLDVLLMSLQRMGLSYRWCLAALESYVAGSCDDVRKVKLINRHGLLEWILANQEKLKLEDANLERYVESRSLSLLGFDPSICWKLLCKEGNIEKCVDVLHHSGYDISQLQSLDKHFTQSVDSLLARYALHYEHEFRTQKKDFMISESEDLLPLSAFRILDSNTDHVRSSNVMQFLLTRHPPAVRTLNFSPSPDLSVMVRDLLSVNCFLAHLYGRKIVFRVLQHPRGEQRVLSDSSFLEKFICLLLAMPVDLELEELTKSIRLGIEAELHLGQRNLIDFIVCLALKNMIGISTQVVKGKQDQDVKAVSSGHSFDTVLWALQILIDVSSSRPDVAEQIFQFPLINMLLEMIKRSKGSRRVCFLSIVSNVLRSFGSVSGVLSKLPHSDDLVLKLEDFMFELYDAVLTKHQNKDMKARGFDKTLVSLPSFLQALIELNVAVTISNSSSLVLDMKAMWFKDLLLVVEFLESRLPDDHSKPNSLPQVYLAAAQHLQSLPIFSQEMKDSETNWLDLLSSSCAFSEESDSLLVLASSRFFQELGKDVLIASMFDFTPSSFLLTQFSPLMKFSTETLQVRFFFLQFLNSLFAYVLPMIDLSRSDSESRLAFLVRRFRSLIFYQIKEKLWSTALLATLSASSGCGEVRINRFSASKLLSRGFIDKKAQKTVFGQIFHQINSKAPSYLRLRKRERAWKTVFLGEFSDDYGGPYRLSLDDICNELQSSSLLLFTPCPNHVSKIGLNQDKYVPVRSSNSSFCISLFEFVGKLMGVAIRTGNLLNLNLPSIVWKYLVSDQITNDDILAIDSVAFNIILAIEKLEKDPKLDKSTYEDILGLDFVVTASDGSKVELLENGADVAVTYENKDQYCHLLRDFRRNEFNLQCEAMKRGMAMVVPYPLLSLFCWDELELMVCGKASIDIDLLRKMTVYDNCSESDPHIQYFWEMMTSRFGQEERCLFLKFVWGRSRLPTKMNEFESKFKISCMMRARHCPDKYLPVSHTCFFSIELPEYSCLEVMVERCLYAITHCVTIDADGTSAARMAGGIQTNFEDDDSE